MIVSSRETDHAHPRSVEKRTVYTAFWKCTKKHNKNVKSNKRMIKVGNLDRFCLSGDKENDCWPIVQVYAKKKKFKQGSLYIRLKGQHPKNVVSKILRVQINCAQKVLSLEILNWLLHSLPLHKRKLLMRQGLFDLSGSFFKWLLVEDQVKI